MQRRSCSHYFASGVREWRVHSCKFDAQVTLCYSRTLKMTNSIVIFHRDNKSSRSRRAKVWVWTLQRASETQPTRELRGLETYPLENCSIGVRDCSIRVFRSLASKHWPSHFSHDPLTKRVFQTLGYFLGTPLSFYRFQRKCETDGGRDPVRLREKLSGVFLSQFSKNKMVDWL